MSLLLVDCQNEFKSKNLHSFETDAIYTQISTYIHNCKSLKHVIATFSDENTLWCYNKQNGLEPFTNGKMLSNEIDHAITHRMTNQSDAFTYKGLSTSKILYDNDIEPLNIKKKLIVVGSGYTLERVVEKICLSNPNTEIIVYIDLVFGKKTIGVLPKNYGLLCFSEYIPYGFTIISWKNTLSLLQNRLKNTTASVFTTKLYGRISYMLFYKKTIQEENVYSTNTSNYLQFIGPNHLFVKMNVNNSQVKFIYNKNFTSTPNENDNKYDNEDIHESSMYQPRYIYRGYFPDERNGLYSWIEASVLVISTNDVYKPKQLSIMESIWYNAYLNSEKVFIY
jgi:hypothetical protein